MYLRKVLFLVAFCQAILKTWMQDLRADAHAPPNQEPLGPPIENHELAHYCLFRKTFCTKHRSYWRWYNGSDWRQVPISTISSLDFGSRYVAASVSSGMESGDKSDNGMVEFHVCDDRDCVKLASSLKGTVERCMKKECGRSSPMHSNGGLDDTTKCASPPSGLIQLINAKESTPSTPVQGAMDEGCDPPPNCFVDDSEKSETAPKTIRDGSSNRSKDTVSEGATSATSRSGFFSHYAYERTCDMLMSMTSSKKLLPSVVVDETEQLRSQHAGKVRQLVRMYNGLRQE